MHQKFASQRPNKSREFFSVECVEAIDAIRQLPEVKAKIKYKEVFYLSSEEIRRFREAKETAEREQREQLERERKEQADRLREEIAVKELEKAQAKKNESNQLIGEIAIGLALGAIGAVVCAISGAEAGMIWANFYVWPMIVLGVHHYVADKSE